MDPVDEAVLVARVTKLLRKVLSEHALTAGGSVWLRDVVVRLIEDGRPKGGSDVSE